MDLESHRPRKFPFQNLEPAEFELLVFLLAFLEDRRVVRPGNPDGGLDALIPGPPGAGAERGWQAKRFSAGRVGWPKCVQSLDEAIAVHDPRHVTYVFPFDLSGRSQLRQFERQLREPHPEREVDWWGSSELTARLIESAGGEQVARHLFGERDPMRKMIEIVRAKADLGDSRQLLDVLGAAGGRLRDDPLFKYRTTILEAGDPPAAPVPGTVMSVSLDDAGGGSLQLDALAREAAVAGDLLPRARMLIGGPGQEDAIKRFERFMRAGGELKLDEVSVEWEQLPRVFADLMEPEERASVIISAPRQVIPMRVRATNSGGEADLDFEMHFTPAPTDWDVLLEGAAAGMTMQLLLRRIGRGGEMSLTWNWTRSRGTNAEQLEGLRFLEALSAPGNVALAEPGQSPLFEGPSPGEPLDEEHHALRALLEDVVLVERWLDTELELPQSVSAAEVRALRQAAALITGVSDTWQEATVTLQQMAPGWAVDAEPRQIQVRRAMAIKLFGEIRELGEEALYLEAATIAQIDELAGGERKLTLRAATPEARLLRRLEPAGSGPAVAGQPDQPTR